MTAARLPARPSIGVVMVSYHTGPALFASLAAVLAEPEVARVVLVDNGNDPGTRARLAGLAAAEPRLAVAPQSANLGFAGGCHAGARLVDLPLLLLLNPDCVVQPGALGALVAAAAAEPGDWIATVRLADPDGREQRGGRRTEASPLQCLGEALKLHRLFGRRLGGDRLRVNLAGDPLPPGLSTVPAISGAFMLMQRATWDRLGGLDAGYFLHVEDLDLCHRLRAAGGRCLVLGGAECRHAKGTSEASGWVVERHKAAGFWRYFDQHYRSRYGVVAIAAIWMVLVIGMFGRLVLARVK